MNLQKPTDLPTQDPGLQLTQSALDHVRRKLDKSGKKPYGIRLGIKKAGCSGYEYVLEYAYEGPKPLDFCFTYDEVNVLMDKEVYLKFFKGGTVMDFKKEGINEGLAFDNPNVAHQCGCGESFTLVDEQ
jgi:iron-sulfur cluster assembly protein